jgi:hypothetical protein
MLIADLEQDLVECMQGYTRGKNPVLADALLAIARPDRFRSMLVELLGSYDRLADIVGRSLWHPNGFAKIVLLSHSSYKLRLHVWENETNASTVIEGNVHNHGWDFSTILLAGSYRHQEFRSAADGDEFFAYKYRSDVEPGLYSLVATGNQTLRCVFDAYLSQGSRFTISSEVLHRVVPDARQPTVSLVLQGPHQPSSDDVFASREISETNVAEADALSEDFLRHELSAILSLPAFG